MKWVPSCTAQRMKFSINDFFSKCDQIRSILHIWSHLMLKISLWKTSFFGQCWRLLCTSTHFDLHEIYNTFNSNLSLETRGVFRYISKAFKRARLKVLLHKIKCRDIDGNFSTPLESFLSYRNHCIFLNGQASS